MGLTGELEPDSDISDAYSGADSADESDDDAAVSDNKGKRRKTAPAPPPVQTKTPAGTPTKNKKSKKNTINSKTKQTLNPKPASPLRRNNPKPSPASARVAQPSTPMRKKASGARGAQGLLTPAKTPPRDQEKKHPGPAADRKASKGPGGQGPGLATSRRQAQESTLCAPSSPVSVATSDRVLNL
jgi:hypothetical protein